MALIDFETIIKIINHAYITNLGYQIQKYYINISEFEISLMKYYSMIIAAFDVLDKLVCLHFFHERVLFAIINKIIV